MVQGGEVRPAQVDHDEIGPLARLERPDEILQAQHPRAPDRGDPQRRPGVHGRRVHRRHLVELRHRVELQEHVQVVVAGRTVGAQPHGHAAGEKLGDAGDARGELHVALGAVAQPRAAVRQDVHLVVLQPDPVHDRAPAPEDPERAQVVNGPCPVARPDDVHLLPRLREVHHERHVRFARDAFHEPQRLRVAGVGRVAEEGRGDHGGAGGPLRDEALSRLGLPAQLLRIGGLEVDEPLARHDPHARLDGGLGDAALVEVAVAAGCRPREDHLGHPQQGAPADHLAVDVLRLGGEHVLVEPLHQGQVVGQPPEAGHGQVGVGVDETRHDEAARGIEGLFGHDRGRIAAGAGKADRAARDPHRRIVDRGGGARQGEQRAPGDEKVDRLRCRHRASPHIPRLARMRRAMALTRSMASCSSKVRIFRPSMTRRPLITTVSTSGPVAQ